MPHLIGDVFASTAAAAADFSVRLIIIFITLTPDFSSHFSHFSYWCCFLIVSDWYFCCCTQIWKMCILYSNWGFNLLLAHSFNQCHMYCLLNRQNVPFQCSSRHSSFFVIYFWLFSYSYRHAVQSFVTHLSSKLLDFCFDLCLSYAEYRMSRKKSEWRWWWKLDVRKWIIWKYDGFPA